MSMERGALDEVAFHCVVVNRFIIENKQITLFLCLAFMPKTGMGCRNRG